MPPFLRMILRDPRSIPSRAFDLKCFQPHSLPLVCAFRSRRALRRNVVGTFRCHAHDTRSAQEQAGHRTRIRRDADTSAPHPSRQLCTFHGSAPETPEPLSAQPPGNQLPHTKRAAIGRVCRSLVSWEDLSCDFIYPEMINIAEFRSTDR